MGRSKRTGTGHSEDLSQTLKERERPLGTESSRLKAMEEQFADLERRFKADEDELQVKARALAQAFKADMAQTETIRSLKQQLKEREREVSETRDELLASQRALDEARNELLASQRALDEARSDIQEYERELRAKAAELSDTLANLQATETDLQTREEELARLRDSALFRRLTKPVRRVMEFNRLREEKRLVLHSGLFDYDWYKATYPDVAATDIDPLTHFLKHGASEGRSPGPAFDANFYLRKNPDVARARLNPLVHYLRFGKAEGRSPTPK